MAWNNFIQLVYVITKQLINMTILVNLAKTEKYHFNILQAVLCLQILVENLVHPHQIQCFRIVNARDEI